jgi:hypothetical protein
MTWLPQATWALGMTKSHARRGVSEIWPTRFCPARILLDFPQCRALGLARRGRHEEAAAVAAPRGSGALLAQVAPGPVARTALDRWPPLASR